MRYGVCILVARRAAATGIKDDRLRLRVKAVTSRSQATTSAGTEPSTAQQHSPHAAPPHRVLCPLSAIKSRHSFLARCRIALGQHLSERLTTFLQMVELQIELAELLRTTVLVLWYRFYRSPRPQPLAFKLHHHTSTTMCVGSCGSRCSGQQHWPLYVTAAGMCAVAPPACLLARVSNAYDSSQTRACRGLDGVFGRVDTWCRWCRTVCVCCVGECLRVRGRPRQSGRRH